MSLKKRAIEGIVVAGSLVMMSTIAQAADLDGVQVRNAAVQAETDFATGGTAGVVARLDQLEAEAFGDIEAATAGVNQTGRLLVATAEEAVSDTILYLFPTPIRKHLPKWATTSRIRSAIVPKQSKS